MASVYCPVYCPHCMSRVEDAGMRVCPSCGLPLDASNDPSDLAVGTRLTVSPERSGVSTRSYVIGRLLGAGGFGKTYIARDLKRNRVVAIKEYFPRMLQPERRQDGSVVPITRCGEDFERGKASFLSEAKTLASVYSVRSVVHVHDYFEKNNTAYMVMEYLSGKTLREVVEREGPIRPERLFSLVVPLMYDLATIHDAGVVHRDIAPDNIILMPDGTLKIMDFGAARTMQENRSMTVMAKGGFSPIEQYQQYGQGPYTDVYALCATLHYCLTGEVPPESTRLLLASVEGAPSPLKPPSAFGVQIRPEAEAMLMQGLQVQPKERPQSMRQVADVFCRVYARAPARGPQPASGRAPLPESRSAPHTATGSAPRPASGRAPYVTGTGSDPRASSTPAIPQGLRQLLTRPAIIAGASAALVAAVALVLVVSLRGRGSAGSPGGGTTDVGTPTESTQTSNDSDDNTGGGTPTIISPTGSSDTGGTSGGETSGTDSTGSDLTPEERREMLASGVEVTSVEAELPNQQLANNATYTLVVGDPFFDESGNIAIPYVIQLNGDQELRVAQINDWQVNGTYVSMHDTGNLGEDEGYVTGAMIVYTSEMGGVSSVKEMYGTLVIADADLVPVAGYFLHYSPAVLANATINQ